MGHTFDVLLETFTWVGFAGGVFLGCVWLVLVLIDGTWVAADAVIEPGESGRVAHWFTADGGVGRAALSAADEAHVAGADTARIFYRPGVDDRMRFVAHAPLTRLAGWLAAGFIGLGVVAVVASLVLMFVE